MSVRVCACGRLVVPGQCPQCNAYRPFVGVVIVEGEGTSHATVDGPFALSHLLHASGEALAMGRAAYWTIIRRRAATTSAPSAT